VVGVGAITPSPSSVGKPGEIAVRAAADERRAFEREADLSAMAAARSKMRSTPGRARRGGRVILPVIVISISGREDLSARIFASIYASTRTCASSSTINTVSHAWAALSDTTDVA
jgi:hypothetical protein